MHVLGVEMHVCLILRGGERLLETFPFLSSFHCEGIKLGPEKATKGINLKKMENKICSFKWKFLRM